MTDGLREVKCMMEDEHLVIGITAIKTAVQAAIKKKLERVKDQAKFIFEVIK